MRNYLLPLLAFALAGCGTEGGPVEGDGSATVDGGAARDLSPICLPGPPDGAVSYPDPKCPVTKPAAPDALDEALKLAGLDRCSCGFSQKDWSLFPPTIRSDAFRLPWYDAAHDPAVHAPPFARAVVRQLDDAAKSPTPVTDALTVAGSVLGAKIAPCIEPPAIDPAQPLARAVAKLITDAGGKPDTAALEADAADVPADLQVALAQVVLAVSDANRAWFAFAKAISLEDLDILTRLSAMVLPASYSPPPVHQKAVSEFLSKGYDEAALIDAAVRLAWAIETAKLAGFAGTAGFQFDQDTPIGRIVLHDAAKDTYEDDANKPPILLVVDTGGDDTYRFPAGAVDGSLDLKAVRHVGVAIDLAGKDTYAYDVVADPLDGKRLPSDADGRYHPKGQPDKDNGPITLSETPRQGAGRMGIGMLFDLGSDGDKYRSLRMSQGFGVAGVGVLYDAGGDDIYEGEAGVQGAGIFGVGLLIDQGGNDTYRTYTVSQGFAYVRAAGFLYDREGADKYLADVGDPVKGGDPLYFTPQLPGRGNSSFTQGAGFGRRAGGPGDSTYMSGGLGVLRDGAGNDVYTTSVFGQGTGYWFGTGILADGGGNDSYDGKWYVQGSAAHFALALFLDDAGDDKYNPNVVPAATSIGVGHDFSTSWHIDLGGNDVYRAPGLSLGSGNANGMGVLINIGGNDEYHAPGEPTLGCGNLSGEVDDNLARQKIPTVGIFVDIGGKDLYDAGGSSIKRGDNVTWVNVREPPEKMITSEHGAGVDKETGSVSIP
ncbi:MAG: hypothetical protein EXR72_02820 [Myxococcales bacterium]|nr:hypothetical protein [Myxococcales bacterium]